MPADVTLTNEEKVTATLAPLTTAGNPAQLDGAATWTVESGDATVVPSGDGLSCELLSGSNVGDSVVTVSADADLGAGVVTISDSIVLHVQGAGAATLGLSVSAPSPK